MTHDTSAQSQCQHQGGLCVTIKIITVLHYRNLPLYYSMEVIILIVAQVRGATTITYLYVMCKLRGCDIHFITIMISRQCVHICIL